MASTYNSFIYLFMHAQAGMGLRSCPIVFRAISNASAGAGRGMHMQSG